MLSNSLNGLPQVSRSYNLHNCLGILSTNVLQGHKQHLMPKMQKKISDLNIFNFDRGNNQL